jgi:hypothetical protein
MTEVTAHLIPGLAFAALFALSVFTSILGVKAMRSPLWTWPEVFALLVFAGLCSYGALAIALGLVR